MTLRFNMLTLTAAVLFTVLPITIAAADIHPDAFDEIHRNEHTDQQYMLRHFSRCSEELSHYNAVEARICMAGLQADLGLFHLTDDREKKFLGSYWFAYGIALKIEHQTSESALAIEKAAQEYKNDRAIAFLKESDCLSADSFEGLTRGRYDQAEAAGREGLAAMGIYYPSKLNPDTAIPILNDVSNFPDRGLRLKIFTEVGMRQVIKDAGYTELGRDMLFMKAGLYDEDAFMAAFVGKFDKGLLMALHERTHKYYQKISLRISH